MKSDRGQNHRTHHWAIASYNLPSDRTVESLNCTVGHRIERLDHTVVQSAITSYRQISHHIEQLDHEIVQSAITSHRSIWSLWSTDQTGMIDRSNRFDWQIKPLWSTNQVWYTNRQQTDNRPKINRQQTDNTPRADRQPLYLCVSVTVFVSACWQLHPLLFVIRTSLIEHDEEFYAELLLCRDRWCLRMKCYDILSFQKPCIVCFYKMRGLSLLSRARNWYLVHTRGACSPVEKDGFYHSTLRTSWGGGGEGDDRNNSGIEGRCSIKISQMDHAACFFSKIYMNFLCHWVFEHWHSVI